MRRTIVQQMMTETNTFKNEEGTQMTTNTTAETITTVTEKNSKFQKYNSIRDEAKSLQEQIAANRKAQEDLVLAKIKTLQSIGRSVYGKCTSGSYADLGKYSWIDSRLQLKDLGAAQITLAEVKSVWKDGKYVLEETGEIHLSRAFLHISDRAFAKLIRTQIRSWKDAQKAELEVKRDFSVQNAQRALQQAQAAARIAEAKLKAAEEAEAKKTAAAEARALRKAQGAERAQAALAAKS